MKSSTAYPWHRPAWHLDLLIRSNGRTVQTCPGVAVLWGDVPGLSSSVGSWPRSWQQFWQQSAHMAVMSARTDLVRAENRIHGSDQHSCSPGGRPVMITDHVPVVLLPPDHAGRRVAAAVPAGGGVEDRRDPDLAPPARGPAGPPGRPPEAGVGGPRAARGPGGRD